MKIIETTFERLPRERLEIGFEGENQRATVRIDCASVFAEYPNATPALIVKPLFADAYPVVVDRNGTDVDWLITSAILSFSGDGEIQLVFYKDQVICKSAVSKIRVSRSLQVIGEMPDPVAQWVDDANRKLAEVDAQIVELEGMVDTATDAATRAEQSESNATTSAANAATSAATASTKAAEAQASANTATAKASEAALSATQARNSAMSAANSESGATAKAAEAAQSAQTAAQKAEQITEAAQTATGKAGEASASATAAQASATNAASSATAASASETAAKASETAAGASATQAAQSAQTANTAAQTAMQKAAEATQSATNAAASATNAATSAETASTKAGEAAQSAQAVAETAEQLADSLEQISQNTADIAEHEQAYNALKAATLIHSTASGAIASFPDGAEMPVDEVTAQINPVQDLHGYDHPWPAGGAKNKMPNAIPKTETINGVTFTLDQFGVFTVKGTATSDAVCKFPIGYSFTILDGDPKPKLALNNTQSTSALFQFFNGNVQVDSWGINPVNRTQEYSSMRGKTCNEYRISVPKDATVDLTMTPMIVENSESDYSYMPYSNICPITGWDGVKVTRTGKNLCDESNLLLAEGWTVTDGVYSGTNTALHIAFSNGFPGIAFKPDTTYTVSLVFRSTTASKITVIGFNYTDGTHSTMYMQDTVEHTVSFTSTSGKSVSNLLLSYGAGDKVYISQMQVEEGSTATAYEPYAGQTYDITLPTEAGTVYGGELTVNADGSGSLVVDRATRTLDGTEPGWAINVNSDHPKRTYGYNKNSSMGEILTTTEIVSSYVPSAIFKGNDEVKGIYVEAGYLWIRTAPMAGMTAVVNWTTYLSNNPLQIAYKLTNPLTYTLTASQIRTLLGTNNIWHDANGDISVGYKANTKLYIDGKIAELVAQIVNS